MKTIIATTDCSDLKAASPETTAAVIANSNVKLWPSQEGREAPAEVATNAPTA